MKQNDFLNNIIALFSIFCIVSLLIITTKSVVADSDSSTSIHSYKISNTDNSEKSTSGDKPVIIFKLDKGIFDSRGKIALMK